jgi:hypothetical protein
MHSPLRLHDMILNKAQGQFSLYRITMSCQHSVRIDRCIIGGDNRRLKELEEQNGEKRECDLLNSTLSNESVWRDREGVCKETDFRKDRQKISSYFMS